MQKRVQKASRWYGIAEKVYLGGKKRLTALEHTQKTENSFTSSLVQKSESREKSLGRRSWMAGKKPAAL